MKIEREINKYENITLHDCGVNIYALKAVIRENVSSLREIYIKNCKFYLTDRDAMNNENPTSNLRML